MNYGVILVCVSSLEERQDRAVRKNEQGRPPNGARKNIRGNLLMEASPVMDKSPVVWIALRASGRSKLWSGSAHRYCDAKKWALLP